MTQSSLDTLAMRLAAHKLPIRTKFISREDAAE
jgi:ribosomal protein L16/L10AE